MIAHTPGALGAIFAAGALSSAGPCVAPRFIAVAGLAARRSAREALLYAGAFVGGLTALYASLGAAAAIVLHNAPFTTLTYLCVAAALAVSGFTMLLGRSGVNCEHAARDRARGSLGGAFLLGGSFGLIVSPCCAPVLTAIVAYAAAGGDPLYGSLLLACYAAGHSLPLFAAAAGAGGAAALLQRYSVRHATALLGGTLMLAVAAYYAVLA